MVFDDRVSHHAPCLHYSPLKFARICEGQCSELPTMSKLTMRTDRAGPWSSQSTEGMEIHGLATDRLPSLLVSLTDSYMTNYWSSLKVL